MVISKYNFLPLLSTLLLLIGITAGACVYWLFLPPWQPLIGLVVPQISAAAPFQGKQITLKTVKAEFEIYDRDGQSPGAESATDAAIDFYRVHENEYMVTTEDQELAGFILQSSADRFFFTKAIDTSALFRLRALIRVPKGWRITAFLHTHPNGSAAQENFSEVDRSGMLSSGRGYFLRTPSGDVRYIDPKVGRDTRNLYGARGVSVCPVALPCLKPHGGSGKRDLSLPGLVAANNPGAEF